MRMIIMNGQRILQQPGEDGQWKTARPIRKADEGVKPGIYNLFMSKPAQPYQTYTGIMVFWDKKAHIVYQKIGQGNYVTHDAGLFGKKPPFGKMVTIKYESQAQITIQ